MLRERQAETDVPLLRDDDRRQGIKGPGLACDSAGWDLHSRVHKPKRARWKVRSESLRGRHGRLNSEFTRDDRKTLQGDVKADVQAHAPQVGLEVSSVVLRWLRVRPSDNLLGACLRDI
jgi:hypothetical protein